MVFLPVIFAIVDRHDRFYSTNSCLFPVQATKNVQQLTYLSRRSLNDLSYHVMLASCTYIHLLFSTTSLCFPSGFCRYNCPSLSIKKCIAILASFLYSCSAISIGLTKGFCNHCFTNGSRSSCNQLVFVLWSSIYVSAFPFGRYLCIAFCSNSY